jgi:hypothetical protein
MGMAATVRWHDDTLHEMARWAARRYRLGKLDIVFRDGYRGFGFEGGSGTAEFHRGHAFIELNSRRTISKLVDILAHELAHCVALKRYRYGGHDKRFIKIGNELVHGWNALQQQERGAHGNASGST